MSPSSLYPPQLPGRKQELAVERARVVSVQRSAEGGDSTVWVEAFQQSSCGKCQAQESCGHGVLQRWFARRHKQYPVRCGASEASLLAVGQWVEIGIPEGTLGRAAMLAYIMPLLGMLVAALLAEQLAFADWQVALCGAAGLCGGMLLARKLATPDGESALEPRLLGPARP